MRRAKTAEAKTQLAKLYDATASYFRSEHVVRSSNFDPAAAIAPHQCPNDGRLRGEAGITPPLSVNCNDGPDGRCVPGKDGGDAGSYDAMLWSNNPVWKGLNYIQEQGHYFHYNFLWANDPEGYGGCQFTIQAFADLDDDGVYSTFERSGAADINGVNAAMGLYIDNDIE
jgi:type IV pilus assembly protein PilA